MEVPEALRNISEEDRKRLDEWDRETKALLRENGNTAPNNKYKTAEKVYREFETEAEIADENG